MSIFPTAFIWLESGFIALLICLSTIVDVLQPRHKTTRRRPWATYSFKCDMLACEVSLFATDVSAPFFQLQTLEQLFLSKISCFVAALRRIKVLELHRPVYLTTFTSYSIFAPIKDFHRLTCLSDHSCFRFVFFS